MEQRIADAELKNEFSARNVETEKLTEILAAMNLSVKEVRFKRSCFFSIDIPLINASCLSHPWSVNFMFFYSISGEKMKNYQKNAFLVIMFFKTVGRNKLILCVKAVMFFFVA